MEKRPNDILKLISTLPQESKNTIIDNYAQFVSIDINYSDPEQLILLDTIIENHFAKINTSYITSPVTDSLLIQYKSSVNQLKNN